MTAADPSSPKAPDTLYRDKTRRLDWSRVRAVAATRWWVGAAIAIAWLTWPYPSIAAQSGTDESWAIALHLAVDRGLDFGREILFTYGPLGFLSQPLLVTTATAFAAFAFAVAMQLAVSALFLRSALRTFPPVVAVLLTYLAVATLAATGFSNLADYIPFLVFLLAVSAVERASTPPAWWVVGGAVLAALELLAKANGGIVSLVLLALVAWRCRPGGLRSEGLLVVTFAVSLTLLWLASGSDLGAMPAWFRESFHVVVSYTDAMAADVSGGQYLQAGFLLLAAGALVVAQARTLGGARGIVFAVACLAYGLAYFKEGFIRDDSIHITLFFAAFSLGLLAVRWPVGRRWATAVLIVAAVGGAAASADSGDFLFRVGSHARHALHEARVLVDPAERHRTYASSRADARRRLGVDAGTLALLQGHTVDVQPYETAAIWAYGLSWRPQLFIQSYMATDHALDLDNARRLEEHGAERILRQLESHAIDGKHPLFLAPESFRVLLCRYRQLRVRGEWQTLGRADDRCGAGRALSSVDARAGEAIPIPQAAGQVVYARLHIHETLKQRIRSLLLKPRALPRVIVDGQRFRLVTDTARGPLVLRLPAAAGFGHWNHSRLVVENVASPYRIDFFARSLQSVR